MQAVRSGSPRTVPPLQALRGCTCRQVRKGGVFIDAMRELCDTKRAQGFAPRADHTAGRRTRRGRANRARGQRAACRGFRAIHADAVGNADRHARGYRQTVPGRAVCQDRGVPFRNHLEADHTAGMSRATEKRGCARAYDSTGVCSDGSSEVEAKGDQT